MLEDKIIEVSTRLFFGYGIKAVSMDQIAQNVGISKRTLYEKFASKAALLVKCLEAMKAEHDIMRDKILAESVDFVDIVINMLVSFMRATRTVNPVFFSDMAHMYRGTAGEEFNEGRKREHDNMTNLLCQGVAEGYILPNTNIDLAAWVFINQAYGIKTFLDDSQMALPIGELFCNVYLIFFRGISTKKGIDRIDELMADIQTKFPDI